MMWQLAELGNNFCASWHFVCNSTSSDRFYEFLSKLVCPPCWVNTLSGNCKVDVVSKCIYEHDSVFAAQTHFTSESERKHYWLCLSLKCMGKHFRHKSNRNSVIASSLLQANDFPEKALKAAYAIWIMTVGNSTPATGDAALNYVEHGFRVEFAYTNTFVSLLGEQNSTYARSH